MAKRSSPPPKAEIYDTDRFGQLYYASRNPPILNLAIAANYMMATISHSGYHSAIMGGWAAYIRGGGRFTSDVDVSVRCTMQQLLTVLRQDSRMCIPKQHGQHAITLFVHTGGNLDQGCQAQVVEVDVIIGGQLNTPPNMPQGTEDVVPANSVLGRRAIRVISVPFHFAGKLNAFHGRKSNNDFIDLNFLFRKYSQTLFPCRQYFNAEHCRYFVDVYARTNPAEKEYIDYMKQILGLE